MKRLAMLLLSAWCCACAECGAPAKFAPGECVMLKSGGEHGVVAWTDAFHQTIVQWPRKAARVDEFTLVRVPCESEKMP